MRDNLPRLEGLTKLAQREAIRLRAIYGAHRLFAQVRHGVSRLIVANDLKSAAGNTTGILDLGYPQLGFAGSGNWFMQAIVGRTWRTLLANAPVKKGHSYSLVAVPPVHILASGGEQLRLSVFGFGENGPATGVELASGVVNGTSVVSWDAGSLADVCCDKKQTFTPIHGAWTISYHVSKMAR